MGEMELVKKIEDRARNWKVNPKNRELLLSGKELEEGLQLISPENVKFMLTREIELIKVSRRYQYLKRFRMRIILLLITIVSVAIYLFKEGFK